MDRKCAEKRTEPWADIFFDLPEQGPKLGPNYITTTSSCFKIGPNLLSTGPKRDRTFFGPCTPPFFSTFQRGMADGFSEGGDDGGAAERFLDNYDLGSDV